MYKNHCHKATLIFKHFAILNDNFFHFDEVPATAWLANIFSSVYMQHTQKVRSKSSVNCLCYSFLLLICCRSIPAKIFSGMALNWINPKLISGNLHKVESTQNYTRLDHAFYLNKYSSHWRVLISDHYLIVGGC